MVLAEELGIDPSPELQRLHQQILVQDPTLEAATAQGDLPQHNLPERLTSFVGRDLELGELAKLVEQYRLVTVTGPGGAGKTSVAVELARRLVGGFPDGVWLVELAPLADGALVPQAVADTIREWPTIKEQVKEEFGENAKRPGEGTEEVAAQNPSQNPNPAAEQLAAAAKKRTEAQDGARQAAEQAERDHLARDDLGRPHRRRPEAIDRPARALAHDRARGIQQQVARLEQVFELIEKKPQGKRCPAIEGIIEEGQEIMKEYKASPALDAGLLSAAQSVEHYEISRYGTLRTWAEAMGLGRARTLLQQTLDEEIATDGALTELAELVVNEQAQATAA